MGRLGSILVVLRCPWPSRATAGDAALPIIEPAG